MDESYQKIQFNKFWYDFCTTAIENFKSNIKSSLGLKGFLSGNYLRTSQKLAECVLMFSTLDLEPIADLAEISKNKEGKCEIIV
jgi:hypothetical protein